MKNNRDKKLAMLAALVVGTTAAVHIINRYIDKQADTGLLNRDHTHTYNWRLSPVTYRKTGSGSPILLLHELSSCSSSYEWSRIIRPLSEKHTIYVVDLPGCGQSEKPNVTYTNYFYVQLLHDFIRNVIQEPCDVVATGISASVAVTACSTDSTLFKKLLFVNPASPYQLAQIPGKRSRMRKRILSVPIFGTMLYHILISRRMLTKEFHERLFYDASKVSSAHIEHYYESGHKNASNGRFLMSSIAGNYVYLNIGRALQTVNNDIIIIGGEHQEYIEDIVKTYQKMNSAIESVTIPETKHLPQLESPKDFLKEISIYLSE